MCFILIVIRFTNFEIVEWQSGQPGHHYRIGPVPKIKEKPNMTCCFLKRFVTLSLILKDCCTTKRTCTQIEHRLNIP